jgi:hypothetical protein
VQLGFALLLQSSVLSVQFYLNAATAPAQLTQDLPAASMLDAEAVVPASQHMCSNDASLWPGNGMGLWNMFTVQILPTRRNNFHAKIG